MNKALLALLAAHAPAFACDYPDEGTMPLHRAVKRVELIPEIDEWTRRTRDAGAVVQFTVSLDRPVEAAGRCYWTVEVAASGRLRERFFVTPDGKDVRAEIGGHPATLAEWRRLQR